MASAKTVRVEITGDPSSFERSMTVVSESAGRASQQVEQHASRVGGAFRNLDSTLGQFGIPFTGALSEIGNKFDEMETHGTSAFQKISTAGGTALAALGVVAVGVGLEGVHLADQYEKAHSNLETAVKNSGGSLGKIQPQIDAQTSSFAKLGYNATAYEGALAAGTLATGSSSKALGLMSHAADLAAFSHTSLEKATIALAKASEGNLRPLKQLGIDLPIQGANAVQVAKAQDQLTAAVKAAGVVQEKVNDGRLKGVAASDAIRAATDKITAAQQNLNDKQNAGQAILDAVNAKTEGASAKAAETFQGKVKALEAELENVGIKIGQFLIPIIEDLVSAISDVIGWFEKHQAAAIALAGVITTVLGAAIAVFVYDKVSSFVSGIGRMIDGLTSLMTKSSETAAAVEADGAVIAESSAAGGAAAGAEGAAAGGAAAGAEAGAGAEAAGGGAAIAAGPLIVLAGLAYGVYRGFASMNDEGLHVKNVMGDLASTSVPELSNKLQAFVTAGNAGADAVAALGGHVNTTKELHKQFNDVLEKSPQYAQNVITALGQAGLSTKWYSDKLQEHILASENARNAQERFSLQAEIVDAKARGDAGAVAELTAKLNAVPTDVQTYLAVNGSYEALNQVNALQNALDTLPAFREIGIRIVGDTGNPNFSLSPNASDRNIKYNVVPV